ncbi:MAG: dihydroorotate dehydrogenase electron transfer subunit [Candidatus Omnitrophota bacterium]|jgi:dihydroorotate dehydrogenase electron transfer subunit
MKPLQIKAEIISNQNVGARFWRCELSAARIARGAYPGQFVEIKINETGAPLLRRPLSIHYADKNKVVLLYEVLGPGTKALALKKPGEFLDLIGPLGEGFDISSGRKNQESVLVAGGMGIAPILFLSKILDPGKTSVIIGARTKDGLLCFKEFKKKGFRVQVATDDGSLGFKGKVTGLLEKFLAARPSVNIYACGPQPMLKTIAKIAGKNNLPAQLSLEAHMACGIGACLGCVVSTTAGFKRVCKDGPVFMAGELLWKDQ